MPHWTHGVVAGAVAALACLVAPMHAEDRTEVERGRFVFESYCVNCHGVRGDGDGPMAEILRVRPADLTVLSRRNGGTFARDAVYGAIDGRQRVRAHGASQMPIWGFDFQEWDSDANRENEIRRKIVRLVRYIETLQRDAE